MNEHFRFADMGDGALLLEFGNAPDPSLALKAQALSTAVDAAGIDGVAECIPGLASCVALYDPLVCERSQLISKLAEMFQALTPRQTQVRQWTIPVHYLTAKAMDLQEAADLAGLTVKQMVELHTASEYRVYMLGFLPGFAYLGGLPDALHLPRRSKPHLSVPAGAVAIASQFTGIYPLESPGGWHVIGRTPIQLWDFKRTDLPLLSPGDYVRFDPVSPQEFERMKSAGFQLRPAQQEPDAHGGA